MAKNAAASSLKSLLWLAVSCVLLFVVVVLVMVAVFEYGSFRPTYNLPLALIVNHEIAGNRHPINTRFSAYPNKWCDIGSSQDLAEFDPNTCAFVMFPHQREPFYCSHRSENTCFELYVTDEIWSHGQIKQTIAGAVTDICGIVGRQESGRYAPHAINKAVNLEVFSCIESRAKVDYHVVVIPRELAAEGITPEIRGRHILEHVHLVRNKFR